MPKKHGRREQQKLLAKRRKKRIEARKKIREKMVKKPKPALNVLDNSRECGDCSVCCHTMNVTEIEKPAYTDCEHQCNGCAIYDTRPGGCKHFECLWKCGLGEAEKRPNKSGYMLYMQGGTMFGDLIVANEGWPGAFEYASIRQELTDLANELGQLIYLMPPDDSQRTLIGPDEKVQEAAELLASKGLMENAKQYRHGKLVE